MALLPVLAQPTRSSATGPPTDTNVQASAPAKISRVHLAGSREDVEVLIEIVVLARRAVIANELRHDVPDFVLDKAPRAPTIRIVGIGSQARALADERVEAIRVGRDRQIGSVGK